MPLFVHVEENKNDLYEVVVFTAAAKAPRLKVFFFSFGTTINCVKVTRQLVASRKVRRAIPVQGG